MTYYLSLLLRETSRSVWDASSWILPEQGGKVPILSCCIWDSSWCIGDFSNVFEKLPYLFAIHPGWFESLHDILRLFVTSLHPFLTSLRQFPPCLCTFLTDCKALPYYDENLPVWFQMIHVFQIFPFSLWHFLSHLKHIPTWWVSSYLRFACHVWNHDNVLRLFLLATLMMWRPLWENPICLAWGSSRLMGDPAWCVRGLCLFICSSSWQVWDFLTYWYFPNY